MSDYLEHVVECECCHERFCTIHDMHWADCSCPGPHDDPEEDDDEEEED